MKRLQMLRDQRGLSRRRMAQLVDVDPPTYGKAERGEVLTSRPLARIAERLEWAGDPCELLTEVDPDAELTAEHVDGM